MPRTINIGSMALGVNNRLEATQMTRDPETGKRLQQLAGADNVDINDLGRLKRRTGQSVAIAGRAHSLWADGNDGFAVINNALQRLSSNGASVPECATVRAGMPDLYLSYSRGADGAVYWTNGLELRRIIGVTDHAVVAQPPVNLPAIGLTSGALPTGLYLVAFTRVDAEGESPAVAMQVQVPKDGGLTFTPTEALRIYMSGPDGDILTYQGRADAGSAATVASVNESGPRCDTLNRALMPAGNIVRHYRGRMLVARDNILYLSDPYAYGLYDPARSFIPLPSPITLVEPTAGGCYIGADKVYWLEDFKAGELRDVLPYPALPRSSGRSPAANVVHWLSEHGVVIGDASGAVKQPQDTRLAFGKASAGATLFREQDGMTQIVGTRRDAVDTVARVATFMDADILRKGTIV